MVHINCLLNPITRKRVRSEVQPGTRLSEQLKTPDSVRIFRNGVPYGDEVLEDGDILDMAVIPQGGEQGKDIGRQGIVIGLQLIAAAAAAPFIVASGGTITPALALAFGGVTIGGRFLANPLIPIKPEK